MGMWAQGMRLPGASPRGQGRDGPTRRFPLLPRSFYPYDDDDGASPHLWGISPAIPPLTPLHVWDKTVGSGPVGPPGTSPWLPYRRKSISCMAAIENTPAACCTKTRRTDMHSRYRMAGAGRPGISEPSRTTVSSSGLSGTRFTMSPVTGCPG